MKTKIATLIALVLTASACSNIATPSPQPKLTGKLAVFNWLLSADVEQDIKHAINKQDYRLIAIAGRGKAIPGLSLAIARKAKAKCNTKFVGGLGDSYSSNKEKSTKKDGDYKKWWQKAQAYAKVYNQKIIEYCLA